MFEKPSIDQSFSRADLDELKNMASLLIISGQEEQAYRAHQPQHHKRARLDAAHHNKKSGGFDSGKIGPCLYATWLMTHDDRETFSALTVTRRPSGMELRTTDRLYIAETSSQNEAVIPDNWHTFTSILEIGLNEAHLTKTIKNFYAQQSNEIIFNADDPTANADFALFRNGVHNLIYQAGIIIDPIEPPLITESRKRFGDIV